MPEENAITHTRSKIEVISNPRVDDLKAAYSLMLWIERENKKEKDPLSNKRSISDLFKTDDTDIERISLDIEMLPEDIRSAIAHFQKDLQHICKS